MRIVSLLPSATETLFALGLGEQVVAVTHECDFPPEAARRPIVTRSTLALTDRPSAGIEAAVALAASEGRSLYAVDTDAILGLKPDLVVAQDICDVCAIPADQVAQDLAGIPMIRQHPHSLDEVLEDIEELARACGADPALLMRDLRRRIAAASDRASLLPRVRGVFLEWIDPPYRAGHWTPDLLALAGIEDPLAQPGIPSVALEWKDVVAARPDLLILAPCGFPLERAQAEADLVREGSDLLLRETLELLAGLPHVDDPNPVVSLRHPVKKTAGQMFAARSEAHLLDHLVVLLERRSLVVLD